MDALAVATVFTLLACCAMWLWPGTDDVDWWAEAMKRWKELKRRGLS